jgi:uncharacterized membrane protein YciS (DUF1049 family)
MGTYTYLKAIVLVIVLLFLTTFGIKNNQPLQVYYYFNIQTSPIPLYGIVYISIIIGIVIGMLVGISFRFSLRGKVRALQRQVKEVKKRAMEEKEEVPNTSSYIVEEEKD